MPVEINGYFILILASVLAFYALDMCGRLLNLGALQSKLPNEFRDVLDVEEYAKSQEYTRFGTRVSLMEDTVSLLVFLAFWWLGGFGWVDSIARSVSDQPIIQGLIFVTILYAGTILINLPMELYDTFVIEERFGFNKMTWALFFVDKLKHIAILMIVGAPLLALIFFLFERFGEQAWWIGWIAVSCFSLLLAYLAPLLIMPLFNKFTPLGDGELRSAIQELLQKCQFPLKEVYEVDGSMRSTKSNAFFTGMGKYRKIALYDTLIEKHGVGEVVAVIAHEIGHFKKKHILKSLFLGTLQMGLLFYLLGLFLKNPGLFDAFGVKDVSVYGSLVFFTFLFEPMSKLLSIGMMMFSRKNEFEADAYAAEVTGRPEDLITGLKKLSKDNMSNLTPHPLYVFMNYSHPPMLDRIEALQKQ